MKHTLISLLMLLCSMIASAQKHALYADAGLCMAKANIGISVAYNYNVAKKLGLGAGIQEYTFHEAVNHNYQATTTLFGELRFTRRPLKKYHFFEFLDLGVDMYAHDNSAARDGNIIHTIPGNSGFYTGLGLGYMRSITKRHGGPYASLKFISNVYKDNQYNIATNEHRIGEYFEGTLVISIGFRF